MKVKVLKAHLSTYWYANKVGEVYEVLSAHPEFGFKVIEDCENHGDYLSSADVRIIKEEKQMFGKADLRTGDLILINDDKSHGYDSYVRVFLNTENGDVAAGCTWFPLKYYSDDYLFNWKEKNGCDVGFVEVWRPKHNQSFKDNIPSKVTHTLIWKKEEKSAEQIQLDNVMQQIANLQGEADKLKELISK